MYYKKIILDNCRMANIVIKVFKGILDHYNEKLYNAYSGVEAIKKLINQKVKITN